VTQKKRKSKPAPKAKPAKTAKTAKAAKPAQGWQAMIERALKNKDDPKPWADEASMRAPRKGTSTD